MPLPEREPVHTLALRDEGGAVLSRYQRLHRFDLPGLVMRLLEKEPDRREQSAEGLRLDQALDPPAGGGMG